MGWWETNREGHSFATDDKGEDLVWGDQPADILDNALSQINLAFLHDVGRLPTKAEVLAGIYFSLGGDKADGEALPETVKEAEEHAPDAAQAALIQAHYYRATGGDRPTPAPQVESGRILSEIVHTLAAPFEARVTAKLQADYAAYKAAHPEEATEVEEFDAEVAAASEDEGGQ